MQPPSERRTFQKISLQPKDSGANSTTVRLNNKKLHVQCLVTIVCVCACLSVWVLHEHAWRSSR